MVYRLFNSLILPPSPPLKTFFLFSVTVLDHFSLTLLPYILRTLLYWIFNTSSIFYSFLLIRIFQMA